MLNKASLCLNSIKELGEIVFYCFVESRICHKISYLAEEILFVRLFLKSLLNLLQYCVCVMFWVWGDLSS